MSQTHARWLSRRPHLSRALRLSILTLAALASAANAPAPRVEGDAPSAGAPPTGEALFEDVTQGALRVQRPGGEIVECPLTHTDVQIDVSGFVARARVTQTFENPWDEPIEAVYVFPLPHAAAVDEMTLVVGARRSVGRIERRAEARRVYEEALAGGHTAALLEQERPNIFTQSVGNIPARGRVQVEIGYVDVLAYDRGAYELHFPMVVGPRYIPGAPASRTPEVTPESAGKVGQGAPPVRDPRAAEPRGTGWSPDTDRVPDASRLTPPVLKPGWRTGHDVSLSVRLEAGVPIRDLDVASHRVDLAREGRSRARIVLAADDAIPNKDFVLTYKVAGARPELALLAHAAPGEDGYFLLMMQPRDLDEALGEAPPRDVCFLIDVSGSMSGEPTAKVIEAMRLFFERLRPRDRVQVVTFAGSAQTLFPAYREATPETLRDALRFTDALRGGGGTEMLRGIRAVLADPVDPERVRVVVMLTDGYIGNEAEIIREVGRQAGDRLRFWTVGVGSSPNRYLLDGVARQGGGTSAVLGLQDDPRDLVTRLSDRLQRAQLSQVEVDWGGLDVYETYPAQAPELWSGRPLVLFGRYHGGGAATLRLSGLAEGQPTAFELPVRLPEREAAHAALASVWARRKIEDLSDQLAVTGAPELEEDITEVARRHRLMSAYTSFVAVDEDEIVPEAAGRPPRRVTVPLPLPEGVSYEGVFGFDGADDVEGDAFLAMGRAGASPRSIRRQLLDAQASKEVAKVNASGRVLDVNARPAAPAPVGALPSGGSFAASGGVEGGVAGGVPGGVWGGVIGGIPSNAAPEPKRRIEEAPQALVEQAADADARLAERAQRGEQAARAALERASAHAAKGEVDAARRELRLAWLLAPSAPRGLGGVVLAEWAGVERAQREQAVKRLPALARRLELVLRNTDLEPALEALAKAAALSVRLEAGSLDDARALRARAELRVSFLDLRGATAAEGLDWLLGPLGLDWRVEDGMVVVASARRRREASAWTYAVDDLTQPTYDELGHAPASADVETAVAALDDLLRRVLPSGATIALLTPERLVLAGDAAAHERAGALLEVLRGARKDAAAGDLPSGTRAALAALRAKTVARSAANAGAVARRRRAAEQTEAARRLRDGAWRLLAGAAEGSLDHEGASELLEACRTAAPLDAAPLARALWALAEARSVDRGDATLAQANEHCARASRTHVVGGAETALYRRLASADDEASLPAGAPAPLQDVARLLASGSQGDAEAVLGALEDGRLRGDDAVVPAAVALRRAGGAAWTRFRLGRATWLPRASLSGGALRLLNRLDGARLGALARPRA
jgi:Ca-activated chloride channel family protein